MSPDPSNLSLKASKRLDFMCRAFLIRPADAHLKRDGFAIAQPSARDQSNVARRQRPKLALLAFYAGVTARKAVFNRPLHALYVR